MRRIGWCALLIVLLLGAGAHAAFAQAAPAAPAAPEIGARAEGLRIFSDAVDKAVRLAELIPEDKYTWRPTPDVRSFSEVFLHLAGGNFSAARRLGKQPPEGFTPQGFDKSTTEKAKVVALLKQSIDYVRQGASSLSDADMEKTQPWFGGRQATNREILFFFAGHAHEHLGQLIAYTRMAGFKPPWTEEAERQRQQAPPKKSN